MQRRTKIFITGLCIIVMSYVVFRSYELSRPTVAQTATTQETQVNAGNPPTVSELLRLVNEERVKVGVAPLTINEDVQKSAQLKADDMFKRDYFSHIIKGTDKIITPEMNALLVSNCSSSSENIFWGRKTNTSESALQWWINSEPHYEAIVNPEYTTTGFGIAGNKIVEHFCITK